MRGQLKIALLGILLLRAPLFADTLTLRSNAEINGSVEYHDDAFIVTARYSGAKTRMMKFGRKEVLTVEINNRNFNSGEPPTNITMLAPPGIQIQDGSRELPDVVLEVEPTDNNKKPSNLRPFVLSSDGYDRMKTDIVMLQDKDKTKLAGRVALLQQGYLTIQTAKNITKVPEQSISLIVIAPE